MKTPSFPQYSFYAALALAVLISQPVGQAATQTWDANGATAGQTDGAGAWKGANQWWDGAANGSWVSGNDAIFGVGGTGGAVTLASATTAQSLTFNPFSGTYTLGTTASILTINGGITLNSGAGNVNLVSAITLGGPQNWTNSSGSTLTVTNAAAAAIVYGGNLLTLNGGAFNFALTGSATTTGAGGVKITAGSAVTNSSTVNPFGTGILELNSGSITNSTTTTNRTISNAVSLTGDFTLGSGGATGTNTFSGATTTTGNRTLTVNTAQAIFNNATALSLGGNLTVNGSGGIALTGTGGITGTSDIVIGTTGTVNSTIGTGAINTTGTITNNGSGASTTTLSGVIASTVTAITQSAANGTLTLSGANAGYAGTTTLNSGTLNVTNAKSLGTGSLVINGGALNGTINALSNTAYSGTFANASSTITLADTTGLVVGQYVYGTGVGTGAFITAIVPNTSITVSTPASAGGAPSALTFGSLTAQTWAADYSFTGTGSLNLGSGAISLGANPGATRTVTVNANTLTAGGVISNGTDGVTPTVNLAKAGAGTLAFTGNNVLGYSGTTTVSAGTLVVTGANTYAGATTLNAGTLRLSNPANTNVLNSLGSSSIALNGGTLQLRANGTTGASTQTIVAGNNVTMGSGAATIDVGVFSGTNSGHNITLGNLTLGTGQINVTSSNSYTANFTGATSTLTGNAIFNPTTGGLRISGVLGESGGSGYSITKIGSGSLTLSGANTFTGQITINAGTLLVTAAAPSGSAGTLGNSTSEVLVGDTTGALATSLQSNFIGTGIARDIRLQSGNTGIVTLNANAGGTGTGTISGNITLGSASGTGHAVSIIAGAGGNAQFQTAAYTGIIQDPTGLSGAGGAVTLNGVGTVILSGTNTYTGGTFLNSGSLIIGNTQALGIGSLTINGGTINQSVGSALVGVTSQTWAGDFGFSSGGGAINLGTSAVSLSGSRVINTNNIGATVGGAISGAGYGLTLKGTVTYTASVTLNGLNTYDGGTTVVGNTSGTFTALSGSASGFGTGQTRLTNSNTSRVGLNVDTTVESLTSGIGALGFTGGTGGTNGTQALVFTGGGGTGAAGTATISGGIITGVNITDYGKDYTSAPTISLSNPGGSGTVTTAFTSSSVALGNKTLTLAGTNASPAAYAGIISGTGGSLVKNGAGVQMLSGANTYTGTTTINQGTLLINGSTVAASAFTVNNSGTLGGSGTVNGSVAVSSGGTLSPGNSPGLLTQGATTLNGGGNYNWQIVDATGIAGAGFDSINLTTGSALTLNNTSGNTFKINLWSLSSIGPDVNGDATNFSNASNYSWTLFATDQTINSFSADKFTINLSAINGTNGFSNSLAGGSFSVALSLDQTDLVLNYTAVPEPSTWLLLAGTGTFFMILRRRRRI